MYPDGMSAMPQPQTSGEFYGTQASKEKVERAAIYAGEAGAMATNSYQAGNHAKAEIWEAEAEVWTRRKDEIIKKAPLDHQGLTCHAAEILCASFRSNAIYL
jgi:hypothetical protein